MGQYFVTKSRFAQSASFYIRAFSFAFDFQATLEKFPNTRLGRLQECRTEDAILSYCDYYSYEDNEYFFDKNPKIFAAVLSCYRTGKLHIPDEFCLTELVTELRYWGFDESCLDMCCQQKYRGRKILYQEMRNEVEYEMYQQYGYQVGGNFDGARSARNLI